MSWGSSRRVGDRVFAAARAQHRALLRRQREDAEQAASAVEEHEQSAVEVANPDADDRGGLS